MKRGDVIKSNSLDRNENISTQGKSVETTVCNVEDVHLFVKEMEEVIARKLAANHNETMSMADQEVAIEVEELEQVIAPGVNLDHKETMVSDSL